MTWVGYQGVPGAYSEEALLAYFGSRARPQPFSDFEAVFRAVVKGKVAAGIVPIENSLAGSIHQNYDLLLKYAVWIRGEHKLRVRHNFMVVPGVRLANVRRVYSHPQALAQCAIFLKALKRVELVPHFDTAGAAAYVAAEGLVDAAAVASARAADNYGLKVLKRGIEDNVQNYTRFLVIGKSDTRPKGQRIKTSVVFALRNIPGAMHKSLGIFALRDIDLLKIESRPLAGSPWQYLFYLDLAGAVDHEPVARALDHLKEISTYCKVLGSYPVAE